MRHGQAQEDTSLIYRRTVRALFNRTRDDDMERIDGVERLRVSSLRSHLAVSLDGEVIRAEPPLDYRIRKHALRVIGP